jgi:4-amino-4-deoxy-L-arabinose transferase-like glycosyltransferase
MAPNERRWHRIAIAALVAGAVLRVLFGLILHPPLDYVYSDMQGYVTRATRLVDGSTLNRFDTFFPPGTHMILALPLKLLGTGRGGLWAASVLWTAISCSVPLLAWRFATRVMSTKAAAITAILVSLWPLYIAYGGFFMSEIPSVASLLLTLWLAFRARGSEGRRAAIFAVAAGLSAGVALAIRPQLVLNVAVAAWTLLSGRWSRRVAVAALAGTVVPLVAVIALNASAADGFVGLSENGGLNFFQGHCPVRSVRTSRPGIGVLEFGSPVVAQQNRGRAYTFDDHMAWEQSFFVHRGLDCARADGIGHVAVLARNVADLGITSVPWPPSVEPGLRRFVKPANLIFSWALPSLIVFGFVAMRSRRVVGRPGLLVAHLLCVFPTAMVFYGDPRFRVPYDVFGLGLFAILLATYLPRGRPQGERDPEAEPTDESR